MAKVLSTAGIGRWAGTGSGVAPLAALLPDRQADRLRMAITTTLAALNLRRTTVGVSWARALLVRAREVIG